MITNSIAHVLQSVLQYVALIVALFLYCWIKDVFPFSGSTLRTRTLDLRYRTLKRRNARSLTYDDLSRLYQWIRKYRQEQGLTQEKLAEQLGVDTRTIQRWERGTRPQPHHYSMFLKLQPFKEVKDSEGPEDNSWQVYQQSYNIFSRRKTHSSHVLRLRFPLILFSSILIILLVLLILRFWLHII